ncbi:HSP20-like chaperone [Gymnopilus junonius]|uniref:HSP20-like chaperone n=1 Tax=Gymnopilus junonius TaxID=109634 RepID=A0A9P5TR96_GYMJU|nr:HSP20-like chaperone [Gymnopilus junonius]
MSITRQFFRELRPLFRMLEEPTFNRPPFPYVSGLPSFNRLDTFQEALARPAIDVRDQGDKYVLDADLPGVPKDNVEIRIGDNGRSVTIEGKITEEGGTKPSEVTSCTCTTLSQQKCLYYNIVYDLATDSTSVTKTSEETHISAERPFTRNVQFTRTVWLPRPVDTQNVEAKLDQGVLTIIAKKAEDKASTVVPIKVGDS